MLMSVLNALVSMAIIAALSFYISEKWLTEEEEIVKPQILMVDECTKENKIRKDISNERFFKAGVAIRQALADYTREGPSHKLPDRFLDVGHISGGKCPMFRSFKKEYERLFKVALLQRLSKEENPLRNFFINNCNPKRGEELLRSLVTEINLQLGVPDKYLINEDMVAGFFICSLFTYKKDTIPQRLKGIEGFFEHFKPAIFTIVDFLTPEYTVFCLGRVAFVTGLKKRMEKLIDKEHGPSDPTCSVMTAFSTSLKTMIVSAPCQVFKSNRHVMIEALKDVMDIRSIQYSSQMATLQKCIVSEFSIGIAVVLYNAVQAPMQDMLAWFKNREVTSGDHNTIKHYFHYALVDLMLRDFGLAEMFPDKERRVQLSAEMMLAYGYHSYFLSPSQFSLKLLAVYHIITAFSGLHRGYMPTHGVLAATSNNNDVLSRTALTSIPKDGNIKVKWDGSPESLRELIRAELPPAIRAMANWLVVSFFPEEGRPTSPAFSSLEIVSVLLTLNSKHQGQALNVVHHNWNKILQISEKLRKQMWSGKFPVYALEDDLNLIELHIRFPVYVNTSNEIAPDESGYYRDKVKKNLRLVHSGAIEMRMFAEKIMTRGDRTIADQALEYLLGDFIIHEVIDSFKTQERPKPGNLVYKRFPAMQSWIDSLYSFVCAPERYDGSIKMDKKSLFGEFVEGTFDVAYSDSYESFADPSTLPDPTPR